jgi:glucoamylase
MAATSVPRCVLAALVATGVALAAPAVCSAVPAPGAPGAKTTWTRADKDGFGTAVTPGSKVWFTLSRGELTEVYSPRLDTPSVRDLELVVSDGRTFTERETVATRHAVRRLDGLTYRQVNTARSGRYRITKTWVTSPRLDAVLAAVRFESLDGRPYRVYALLDPALRNDGDRDRGRSAGATLTVRSARAAAAFAAAPAFRATTSGYAGTRSDPWRDLRSNHRLDRTYGRTVPATSCSWPGRA